MQRSAYVVLRVGLAITFIWIAAFIFQAPEGWGSFIQPWAQHLLPIPLRQAMLATAVLDLLIGLLLLAGMWTWLAALVGAFHIATVLITVGINDVTVRDVGLLAATAALAIETTPSWILARMSWKR
jgi:uncharacterized membrane protein YphA (DoxX/SURF4 family)